MKNFAFDASGICFQIDLNLLNVTPSLDKTSKADLLIPSFAIFILNKEDLIIHLEEMKDITNGLLYLDLSSGLSQVIISDKDKITEDNIEKIETKYLKKMYE